MAVVKKSRQLHHIFCDPLEGTNDISIGAEPGYDQYPLNIEVKATANLLEALLMSQAL